MVSVLSTFVALIYSSMEEVVRCISSRTLILEVQKHKILYSYNNKSDKESIQAAWEDLMKAIVEDFEEKAPNEKKDLGK